MRTLICTVCGVVILSLAAPRQSAPGPSAVSGPPVKTQPAAPVAGPLDVSGLTQCAPGRRGIIAPVPLHPVLEVKVVPGQRVKKGQELVILDDDEARADVRLKQALLDSARQSAGEARRFQKKVESVPEIMPEQRLFDARLAVRKTEADERAAKAALDSAEAELEHFHVTAIVDGIVSRLDVCPGVVARPGTTVWGEIVDLRELDVRCELRPEQADHVAVGQKVEVRTTDGSTLPEGRITFIGPVADAKTGHVPVLVRFPNPEERVRCGVNVSVRFTGQQTVCKR